MRLGSLASARPQYYDRNAIGIANSNSQNITGNTTTVFTMYTVPAGKKFILSLLAMEFFNNAVMTGAGAYVSGYWQVTFASPVSTSTIAFARFAKTAVGDEQWHGVSPAMALNAGDILKFTAQGTPLITAANVSVLGSIGGTEFDA